MTWQGGVCDDGGLREEEAGDVLQAAGPPTHQHMLLTRPRGVQREPRRVGSCIISFWGGFGNPRGKAHIPQEGLHIAIIVGLTKCAGQTPEGRMQS